MQCITCGTEHDSAFCPNCGEKAVVPSITFRSMLQDLIANSLGTQKGFFYNLKYLFTQPKPLVESYLKGRRKNIQNPASYLFIAVTLYLIVDALIDTRRETGAPTTEFYSLGYAAGQFIRAYFKYFWILSIIWLSLASKLVFRTYRLAEHLAINAFVIGQATLVGIGSFVILKLPILFDPVVLCFLIWMLYRIYWQKGDSSLLKAVATVFFFVLQLLLLALLGGWCRTL
ncbi:MAG: DUF3667 domain-containing protein [Bacteroidota bacterium]